MLCNNEPACAGRHVHASLEFQLKHAISQTRDEVEWVQLCIGVHGLDPAKAVWVSWPLFFFCGGIAVGLVIKEDVLGSLQQLLDLLVYLHASYGTSTGMAGLQSVLL